MHPTRRFPSALRRKTVEGERRSQRPERPADVAQQADASDLRQGNFLAHSPRPLSAVSRSDSDLPNPQFPRLPEYHRRQRALVPRGKSAAPGLPASARTPSLLRNLAPPPRYRRNPRSQASRGGFGCVGVSVRYLHPKTAISRDLMDNPRRTDIVRTDNCLPRLGHEDRLSGTFLIEFRSQLWRTHRPIFGACRGPFRGAQKHL